MMSQSSIWARRMVTKSVPASDVEVELNVLSLLLGVPVASLEEAVEQDSVTRFGDMYHPQLSLEVHTAQTAVKAALDVLQESSFPQGLRISAPLSLDTLTAPLSPSLSSPLSPAESCFSASDSETPRRKGRARMSQEKRKRLARRREREAMVATMQSNMLPGMTLSSPTTPVSPMSYASSPYASSPWGQDSAVTTPVSNSCFDFPSSPTTSSSNANTSFGSVATPSSSPTALAPIGDHLTSSSPPTLVVQPPSPQRLKQLSKTDIPPFQPLGRYFAGFVPPHLASVY